MSGVHRGRGKKIVRGADRILEAIFVHGYLAKRHLHSLAPGVGTEATLYKSLQALVGQGLLERSSYANPLHPKNTPGRVERSGNTISSTATRAGRTWEYVYGLTEEGLGYVAEDHRLGLREARKLYNKVRSPRRMAHALLRTEYFTLVAGEAERPDHGLGPGGVAVRMIGGENVAGYLPLPTVTVRGAPRTFEPDGLMLLEEHETGRSSVVYVEADTGSQDKFGQIATKASNYAQHFADPREQSPLLYRANTTSKVVFVSPDRRRSETVRRFILSAAADPQSDFSRARMKLNARTGVDLSALVLVTCVEWLRSRGALGDAYWPLDRSKLGPLLP